MSSPVFAENNKIDLQALSDALQLRVGERVELAHADERTGDYRVFYVGLEAMPEGGAQLVLELHRQTPQLKLWLFELLTMTLAAPDAQGFCTIQQFEADAAISPSGLQTLLPALAQIIASLRQKQLPNDALLRAFLSRASHVRWVESRMAEGAL